MQRPFVLLLAAVDAAVAVAVGLAALLAPLTLFWVLALGAGADWGVLWPTTVSLWQFGHGVPLEITIPDEVLVAMAISPDAAQFTLSLAPTAFLLFTVIFAARSGARSAKAGAWLLGILTGTATMTALAWLLTLTGGLELSRVQAAQAIAFPALAYLIGVTCGALAGAWRHGDDGIVDRVRAALERSKPWGAVPAHTIRGGAMVVVALTALGAAAFTLAIAMNAGGIVALFEILRVDGLGAAAITLGQLAYVPTFVVWSIAWLAGPGFAVGAGTAVSPAGTELGVVPAIPVLAALPEGTSMWALIVILAPVAAGAFAGWAIRSRLVWSGGDLPLLPRAAIALGIAGLAAAFGALAAVLASGSVGPGRMGVTGPEPGTLALALGLEVFVGAAILLLSPRNRDEVAAEREWRRAQEPPAASR